MMTRYRLPFTVAVALGLAGLAGHARAQTPASSPTGQTTPAGQSGLRQPVIPRWARVSFFAHGASTTPTGGEASTFSEVTTNVSARSAERPDGGFVYGLDLRVGAYPSSEERDPRTSVYDAFVGRRFAGGRLLVKAGQMWLNDLGGLGSFSGAAVEYTHRRSPSSLHVRMGAFGGLEPRILEAGYVPGVQKIGGYVAVDNGGARKHVLGYVNVRHDGLSERSVLSLTNYVPVGQVLHVYQALEYDLAGPAGQGQGGLSYFFANGRLSPTRRADVQVTYHRGRSIDARTITDDVLAGRPVSAKVLDGYLYASANARVTVEVWKGLRLFGGYGRDTNGNGDAATDRVSFGLYSSNLFGSGFDLTVTDYRYQRAQQSAYDSWYVSVGRSVGSRIYLSGEYSTSLSVIRYTPSSGITIETRPTSERVGGSLSINLSRALSLLITGEHTTGTDYSENRMLSGLVVRF